MKSGQIVFTDKQYNNRGYLHHVSNSYLSGGTPVWSTFSYDTIGRLNSTIINNTTTSITYSNSTTTYSSYQGGFNRSQIINTNGFGQIAHEHLDEFGLIHMNGRLYDTQLGRFLNPDPIIQDPLNIQNYNLYSYCLNNPLEYVDPSGYEHDSWLKRLLRKVGSIFTKESTPGTSTSESNGPTNDNTPNLGGGGGSPYNHLGEVPCIGTRNPSRFFPAGTVAGPPEPQSQDGGYTDDLLGAGSFILGATGYHVGGHMSRISRFAPIKTLYGGVVSPATSMYRYGPLSGELAVSIGKYAKIGGNILGGVGIGYTFYQMGTNQVSVGEGMTDVGK